jgi:hypothetical protein
MTPFKAGDLVRFRYPYREKEKGVFLVVKVEGRKNTWILLHNGPDLSPDGTQTLHNWTNLEVVSEVC